MKLDLHIITIKDIRFGERTLIQDGVLTINRDELRALLEIDKRFERVEIEIARPGERCRIIQVADVIEPRGKMGGDGTFGYSGKHQNTGEGKTCVLRGAAVVLIDDRKGGDTASMDPRDHLIDMSGPASEVSTYGKTFNVVLLPKPKKGVTIPQFQAGLKLAGLKAAAYLAWAGRDLKADEVESYDLPPLTEVARGMEELPKVVYIPQVLSLQYEPIPAEPTLFGVQAGGILPTILHPNQILDGAVTSALPGLNVQTYRFQNHPIIQELYRRHGKELCFAGVIATIAPNNVFDFDRMANIAASLAKWVLGADGAVLTKTGGGAPELAMARTAQRCEQLGIRTAIAMLHMGADFKDARFGASTIFSMPEVDAIVSMGFPFSNLVLPPVERVIGSDGVVWGGSSLEGEVTQSLSSIYGALCQFGSTKWTAVRY
ncbi:MAG: beta-aspartyl-peptidase [Deltaproteobacteria bacterium HGW-Deltaproteobacteria-15]|jgi:glycine reductase|nr:MAG: beta-aspartyl-peptidase [Deltaproteobacteria bacterium HGW-Deltaproteobacteria-15]